MIPTERKQTQVIATMLAKTLELPELEISMDRAKQMTAILSYLYKAHTRPAPPVDVRQMARDIRIQLSIVDRFTSRLTEYGYLDYLNHNRDKVWLNKSGRALAKVIQDVWFFLESTSPTAH